MVASAQPVARMGYQLPSWHRWRMDQSLHTCRATWVGVALLLPVKGGTLLSFLMVTMPSHSPQPGLCPLRKAVQTEAVYSTPSICTAAVCFAARRRADKAPHPPSCLCIQEVRPEVLRDWGADMEQRCCGTALLCFLGNGQDGSLPRYMAVTKSHPVVVSLQPRILSSTRQDSRGNIRVLPVAPVDTDRDTPASR